MNKDMNWAVAWYGHIIAKFWLWNDAKNFADAQDEEGYKIVEINND